MFPIKRQSQTANKNAQFFALMPEVEHANILNNGEF